MRLGCKIAKVPIDVGTFVIDDAARNRCGGGEVRISPSEKEKRGFGHIVQILAEHGTLSDQSAIVEFGV